MRSRFLTIPDLRARDGEEGGLGAEAQGGLLGDNGDDSGTGEFVIPEKFLVKSDAGEVDYQAVLKKALPAYTQLEKRMGSGEAPPKSADEYKLEPYLPEGSTMPPESEKRIFTDMHALGLNNKQLQGVMGLFGNYLGESIAQEKTSAETAMASLKQVWPGEGEYDQNLKLADSTLKLVAPELYPLITKDPKLQSNPVLIRLLAIVGADLKEDTSREQLDSASVETITALKRSEAYLDAKHPDHKDVVARVSAAYQKGYKEKQ